MDIKEIKKRKQELSNKIRDSLFSFIHDTELSPKDIVISINSILQDDIKTVLRIDVVITIEI